MLDPLWKNNNSHLKMFWNFEIKEIEVLLSLAVWSHSICWLCKKEHDSGVAFIGLMRRLPFVDQVAQMPKRNKKGGKAVLFVTFQLCMFSFPVLGPLCTKGRIQYAQTCNLLPSVLKLSWMSRIFSRKIPMPVSNCQCNVNSNHFCPYH